MTSRFLSGNSTDLSALQDGSFALNVASAMVADLAPGLPVRVGLDHSLASGQITVADCAFTPSTNPATGDLDLAGHNITNVGTISGATNSRTADNIVSSAGNGVAGNLPTWTGTSKVLQDSGTPLSSLATTAALTNYLPTAGGTMTGSINMGGNPITDVVNLVLPNSVPGTVTAGNTLIYSSGSRPRYKDSTGVTYQLANSDDIKSCLKLTGGTMAGNIDMANNQITNCWSMSFPAGGQITGPTNTRAADNIVSNPGSATPGNLAWFPGVGGKIIADSGLVVSKMVVNVTGGTLANQIATFSDSIGTTITNSSNPILGTPASGTLTNCSGLPIGGVSGLGSGVATMLGSFTSGNIAAACTNETGTGSLVFSTQPDFIGATQRFQPLKLSTLTQYDAFTVNGTSAANSFITASSIGTRFWAANTTNTGMVIKATANAQLNSWSGGGTLTISLYVNGTACVNLAVPTGTAAGSYLRAKFDCTIRAGTACRGQGALLASGQLPVLSDGNGTWTKTSSNNVDLMFQWSVASAGNMISPLSASIETHYQNS